MKSNIQRVLIASGAVFALAAPFAANAQEGQEVVRDRSIAYVMTMEEWAMHKTPGAKAECPNGMNEGPREQFKVLFPENGPKRTVVGTQLARESQIYFPEPEKENMPFKEAVGPVVPGVNLDGKIDADDFTNADGGKGIDNQFFRVIGCVSSYRDVAALMVTKWRVDNSFNRVVIELTDVDDLVNDPDVTVTTYRGLSPMLPDATGNGYMPGASQKLDMRFGKDFITSFKGKIVDGVLTTEPADYLMPYQALANISTQLFRGVKWDLRLTQDGAEGYMGGYVDLESWHAQRQESISTHHQSYGQESSPTVYKALKRLADGYPDAAGQNTAISSALHVRFTQVFIERPAKATAQAGSQNGISR
ncbi:MAG: hypothetical protein LCH56_13455 [Proteobacteria bacterium]|nr:hypothetical protein [Pseudomonadota bacterium]